MMLQPRARLQHGCCRGGRALRLQASARKTSDGPSVAIVGVTGAVGQEFLQVSPPRPQALRA